MNRDLRNGILTAGTYYGLGTLISFITYWIFGEGGAHVPGLYMLVVMLLLFLGAIWLLYNLLELMMNHKNSYYQGTLIIHAFVFFVVIAFIGYEYYIYS